MNHIFRRFLPLLAVLPACLASVPARAASAPNAAPLPWSATDVASAPDGSARILWTRSDGAEGLWVMSPSNQLVNMGQIYGPYSEAKGTWSAKAMRTAADGTSRILWVRSDGAAGIWTVDNSGNELAVGPTFGPYDIGNGVWHATDIAVAHDGTSRLLWTNDLGEERVWTVDNANMKGSLGQIYGPYSDSGGTWSATHVSVAGDGTSRVLWNRSDGAMTMWNVDATGQQRTSGATYGPFYNGSSRWTAVGIASSSDGTARILWDRADGAMGIWSMNDVGSATLIGQVYGPYAGFTASRIDLWNTTTRVLWVRSDRAAGLWSFNANDTGTVVGSVYGPY